MFLFFFDFYSAFDRKNPLGLIKAFQKAFRRNDDVVLVIKSINSHVDPEKVIWLKEAARDLKVRFIHEHISRPEMLSLMATCDCFVSLHRSEGFGLGLAQAMCLGKPVIGTAWSGNMDFMNANNSFLVKYGLIGAVERYGPYPKGSIWADPDIDHAAELMRLVYENRELGSEVGRRASAEIKRKMNPAITGIEISRRLQEVVVGGVQTEGGQGNNRGNLVAGFHSYQGSDRNVAQLTHRQRLVSRSLPDVFPGIEKVAVQFKPFYHIPASIGTPTLAEALALAAMCSYLEPDCVFEIGTYRGHSTLIMSMNTLPEAKIITLDLPPEKRSETKFPLYNQECMEYPNFDVGEMFRGTAFERKIEQLFGDSACFDVLRYRRGIDLIFIDGNHAYENVRSDSEIAFEMLRPGGVIIWDDYWQVCPDVVSYLEQLASSRVIYHIERTRLAVYVGQE